MASQRGSNYQAIRRGHRVSRRVGPHEAPFRRQRRLPLAHAAEGRAATLGGIA